MSELPDLTGNIEHAGISNPNEPVVIVGSFQSSTGDGFPITIYADGDGEQYARIRRVPEKQRFASLLMRSVCNVASVVQARNEIYTEGEHDTSSGSGLAYYSHRVNPGRIQPRNIDELRAEMFLVGAIVGDNDHLIISGLPQEDSDSGAFHNAQFELGRYYIFDFDQAFDRWSVFHAQTTEAAIVESALGKLEDLFVGNVTPATILPLLGEKVRRLQALYAGNEGHALFDAQLNEANIDDSLTEIFGTYACQQWDDPRNDFYRYFMLRVNAMDKLLSNPTALRFTLLCRGIGRMLTSHRQRTGLKPIA